MNTVPPEPPRSASAIKALAFRWRLHALLAGIIALGALVRIAGISDNPPGFFTDEASVGYNAYTVLNSGRDEHGESWPLLFRAFGEYKLPVFIYSLVPFVAALGLTEFAVRLAAATYGTLAILTTYLFVAQAFHRRSVGLAAAFFLAIMPWHIHYSRTGFGELISFPPFLALGLYLFLKGVRRNELWLPSAAVLGLTLYTYRAAWLVLPPILLLLAVMYRRELLAGRRLAIPAGLIILALGLPIVVHLLSGSGDRSQQAGILSLDLGAWETVERFAAHYRSYFSLGFLFKDGDNGAITRHYLPGFGHLYWVQLPLMLLGILGLVLSYRREKMIVLALLLLYPLAGALSTESPISTRTILGSVAFATITGYGLVLLLTGLGKLNYPYGRAGVAAVLATVLVLALVGFASYLGRYHSQYPKLSAGYWGWQAGPKEIIEYFLTVEDDYDQLVMDGEFNAPHMFLLFYAPDRCKKCTIGNTDRYDTAKRQLFALKPKNMPRRFDYHTRHAIGYPDGERAFTLVEITGRR